MVTFIRMLVLFCLCGAGPALGQTPARQPFNLAFRHILPDQLETIGYVTAISQDGQGFMWFGGSNGLARYDGYTLKFFKHEDGVAGSLSHSYVNALLTTRDGSLWVGTQSGLNRFDPATETFTVYRHEAHTPYGLSVSDVRALLEDRRGRLWLATRGGLNLFDRADGGFARFYYEPYPQGAGDSLVYALAEDQAGNLWIGNRTGGLTRFNPEQNTFSHYRFDPDDPASISANDVRAVFVDRDNQIWAGTHGGGLNRLGADRQGFERFPFDSRDKSDIIWEIHQDSDGRIWLGDGGGVALLDPASRQYQRFAHDDTNPLAPGNHVVNSLFRDRAGDMWVGYFPAGVDVVDRQASVFRNFTHIKSNPASLADGGVLATYEDTDGRLWVGAGYGLSMLAPGADQFVTYRHDPDDPRSLSGDTVLAIEGDDDGRLWLGIWAGGLSRFDPDSGEVKRYQPNPRRPGSLVGREPWGLHRDPDGVLWIATEKGLNRYNPASDDFTYFTPPPTQSDGDAALYSRAVLRDRRGDLWLGSIRGLFRVDPNNGTFERFRHRAGDPQSLSNDYVTVLYEDSRGRFWVGTHGGGLNLFDRSRAQFQTFSTADGLPDDVITSIVEDSQGALWVSTHQGLAEIAEDGKSLRVFDKRHGLSGNLFNRNTASRLRDGRLAFGSTKGLTLFEPAKLQPNTYVPPVVITDFKVFNRPVVLGPDAPLEVMPNVADTIQLGYQHTVFSLTFAALNYRSPDQNQYAYKLEGFDQEWHYVENKRTATYTNLDPGQYTFRVRGSNNEGVWNEAGARIELIVAPPLWRTWWAFGAYAALAAGLLVIGLSSYLKRKAYEREHLLNQRLQELDKLKDEFLANTSHELRTPLNGIIGLSESLLQGVAGPVPKAMQHHLEMIAFSGRRLANLVNDILDYSRLKTRALQLNQKAVAVRPLADIMCNMTRPLLGAKPVALINAVPDGLPAVYADENRLQQILYNLMGNAIKFTERGSVTISASVEDGALAIDVTDTGIGIPPDQVDKIFESFEQLDGTPNRQHGGTGLGLAISKRLTELHGGQLSVSSTLGLGSRFRVLLPLAPRDELRQNRGGDTWRATG